MPKTEYELLPESIKTVRIDATKSTVRFMLLKSNKEELDEDVSSLNVYRLALPQISTSNMKQRLLELSTRMDEIDETISANACYVESIKKAVQSVEKEIEFETYATGMADENLSPENEAPFPFPISQVILKLKILIGSSKLPKAIRGDFLWKSLRLRITFPPSLKTTSLLVLFIR